MEHRKEFNLNGLKVVIDYDQFSESPRNWSESKWYGVDENAPKDLIVDEDNRFNPNCEELKDKFWFKVYKYEHTGVDFSLTPFADKWDSCFYGVIAVPKSSFKDESEARDCIISELDVYTKWSNGEVYGYQIFDLNDLDNEVDSCWSFFDLDECESEAKDMVTAITEQREKKSVEFWTNNAD